MIWSSVDFSLRILNLNQRESQTEVYATNQGGAAIATGFRGRGRPDFRRAPVTRINERIRVPQVRVITDDGEQFGVMDTRDAVRLARERGMDLVEVAPNAEPPVCKIIDFGKFHDDAKNKANEAH